MDSTSTRSALPNSPTPTGWLTQLSRFLELVRFSHTVFALPFAVLASVFALSAEGGPELSSLSLGARLIGVMFCMVFARSAAMAFNRLVDAKIDARNPRTAQRHIPAGTLSSYQVWIFFVAMCSLFIASCLLFLPNWLPLVGAVPVLIWICGYSLAKRFTASAHLWLGAALALSPICAWIAIRGESVLSTPIELLPTLVLALAIAFWVAGFDIIYACQDAEFDRESGLRSIPARFGIAGGLKISAALHVLMLCALFSLPLITSQLSLGTLYFGAVILVAMLVIRQHWLVSPNDLRRVGIAFFNINAIISLGFCTLAAVDALL